MKIMIQSLGKPVSRKYSGSVNGLLELLNINPETVIVARSGELLTEDDELTDSDEITVLSVVSGG